MSVNNPLYESSRNSSPVPETGPAPFLPYFFGEEEPPSPDEAPLLPEGRPSAATASPMLQMVAAGRTTFGLGDSSSSDEEEGRGRRAAGDGGFSFGAAPRAPQSEGGSSSSSGSWGEGGAGGGSGFGSAPSPPMSQSNHRGSGSAAKGVFRTYDNPAAVTGEENVAVGGQGNERLHGLQLHQVAPTTFNALPAMQQNGQLYGQQAPFTPYADGVAHIVRDSRQSSPMGSAAGDGGRAMAKQQLDQPMHATSELFSDDALGRQAMTSPRQGSSWLRAPGELPAAAGEVVGHTSAAAGQEMAPKLMVGVEPGQMRTSSSKASAGSVWAQGPAMQPSAAAAPAVLSTIDMATPADQRQASASWGGVTPSAELKPSEAVWREEGRRSAGGRTPTWALDRPGSIWGRSSGGGGAADASLPVDGGVTQSVAAQQVASVWISGGGGAAASSPVEGGAAQPVVAQQTTSIWSSPEMGSVLSQAAAAVPHSASVTSVPGADMSPPGNTSPGGAPRLDVSWGSSGGMEALQQEALLLALGLDQEEAEEEGEGETGPDREPEGVQEMSPVLPLAASEEAVALGQVDLPPLAFMPAEGEEEEEAARIQEAQLPSPAAWCPPPLPTGVALQETQQVG